MMMANRHRGEVAARLDGRDWTLCLTLGALAELESAFETDNLSALVARFSSGRLSARDMQRIICAGLRGGGHTVSEEDVADMRAEGGVAGFARIVSSLLTVTFGTSEKDSAPNP
ncbi:gene transfer agent family protein [Brucella sp. 6810]|uniref:gene transfer agent family protein n=1 Tax=unclassified Brucella TaxID=2632610 RepID=UPI001296316D|nr:MULTISPECIES: gene transfer agent family protein [unclassified Brucella]QGA57547.1 gene transfer agent family protein [Brucella sp. 2280]QNQ62095.1 gene transfer agent family protein [Brucella sp. 6810]QTN98470.1 gene transfer agent family protein [Brucella sp. 458]